MAPRWRFAASFSLVAFGLCSFLPIWHAIYIGSWEATGGTASFWTMLGSVPPATKHFGVGWVLEYYWFESVKFNVVVVGGFGLGWWLAGQQDDSTISTRT